MGTEYQKAVDRINRIHKKNEEYSLRAEIELDKELKRNNHGQEMLSMKRRAVSVMNGDVYRNLYRNPEFTIKIGKSLLSEKITLFKNMGKIKMAQSKLGNILKKIVKKLKKGFLNFSKKELRDGKLKRGELIVKRLKHLKNA